jgi:chromosome segregation ATPase
MREELERIANELDEDNFATSAATVRRAASTADDHERTKSALRTAQAEIARLQERNATLLKVVDEHGARARGAEAVLREVEWWASEHLSGEEGVCPVCRAYQSDGHAEGCKLAAALD